MSGVIRKTQSPHTGVDELRKPPLGQIQKIGASHLADPSVEDAGVVGEESDELSICRDGGIALRAFPVSETREAGVSQWVFPEVVGLPQAPDQDCETQQ